MEKSFFISRVNELLVEKGWKVAKLSEESGIPASTIYNMMRRGSEPKIETAFKIIAGFHISVDKFLNPNSEHKEPTQEQWELLELTEGFDEKDWLRIIAYARALYEEKHD
ncbi:MAG: helix-turn-helix domain-containing protein [Lachnospiraceae bacterium]|nr:helix-turn-helix domain-containing protein [Lachnospiraceae bacterium]